MRITGWIWNFGLVLAYISKQGHSPIRSRPPEGVNIVLLIVTLIDSWGCREGGISDGKCEREGIGYRTADLGMSGEVGYAKRDGA